MSGAPPATPPAGPPPTTPAPTAEEQRKAEREELLKKAGDIIKEYKQESDIPIGHEYWDVLNRYRSLLR